MRLLPLALGMALLAGGACSSEECLDNKNSLPLAGFYSSSDPLQGIVLDSISIYGIGAPGDSVLHDSVRQLSQSYLPFRIDEERTTYVIRYLQKPLGDYGIADTVTFSYEIIPHFVSAACGAVYNYKLRGITTTRHIIDSVTCPSGMITNKNVENIKIYFRVTPADD